MNYVPCSFSNSCDHVCTMSRILFPASLLVNSYKETRDTLGFSWAKKHRKVGAHLVLLCLTDAMFSTNWGKTFHQQKDYSLLYFNIHCIVVLWKWTCNISEIRLYSAIGKFGSEGEHDRKEWGSIEHGDMRFPEWRGNHVYFFYGIYLGLLYTREKFGLTHLTHYKA